MRLLVSLKINFIEKETDEVQIQVDVTDTCHLFRSPTPNFITHAVVTKDQSFTPRISSNAANFVTSAATVRLLKDSAS